MTPPSYRARAGSSRRRARPGLAPLGGDSVALIATSGLTAGTGLAFWALAARGVEPHDLGLQAALLSVVATVGAVAAAGTGNAFTALLPVPGCDHRARVRDGCRIVTGTALTLSVVGVVGVLVAIPRIPWAQAVVVVLVGGPVAAFFALKDAALVGVGAARRLPVQNLVVGVTRVAALPLCIATVYVPIVVATVVPSLVAAVYVFGRVLPRVRAAARPGIGGERTPGRRDVRRFAVHDGASSVLSLGIVSSLPFTTTVLAGPVEGGRLALVLPFAQCLDLVGVGVGTALTTHLVRGTARGRELVVWVSCLAVVAAGALAFLAVSRPLLAAFAPGHDPDALRAVAVVLVGASVLRVSFTLWTATLRARRRTATLLRVQVAAAAVTVPVVLVLTPSAGAVGAALGLASGAAVSCLAGVGGLLGLPHRLGRSAGAA